MMVISVFLLCLGCSKEIPEIRLYSCSDEENVIVLSDEESQQVASLLQQGKWENGTTKTAANYIIEYDGLIIRCMAASKKIVLNDEKNNLHMLLTDSEVLPLVAAIQSAFEPGSRHFTDFLYVGMPYEDTVRLFGNPVWLNTEKSSATFTLIGNSSLVITYAKADGGSTIVAAWEFQKA